MPAPPRRTILLLDAFPDERDLYAEFLRYSGFDLAFCRCAAEAVDTAAARGVDVVVMRIRQPGTVDGIQLTEQIKRDPRTRHIPVILITTHVDPGVRARARQAGCDSYLLLPCLPEDLAAEAQRLIARRYDPVFDHIAAEFREMPGLRLSIEQACRLWQIDTLTCQAIIDRLIGEGLIRQGSNGTYVALGSSEQTAANRRRPFRRNA